MHAETRTTSALAIVSLVFGVLAWSALPVLAGVVAIVTGHIARGEIRRGAPAVEGDGLAVAGLVLGYTSLLLGILVIAGFLMFFGGMVWLSHWT